jgi:adenylate cyclase
LSSDGALKPPPQAPPRWRRILGAPGRLIALLLLVALVLLRAFDPPLIKTIRMRGYDLEQKFSPRIYQPVKVRIVAIDGKTIDKYGQWPWPRTQLANLVDKIAQGKPRVLGVDMIFSEPDRFSPSQLATTIPDIPKQFSAWLETRESNDAVLAEAFAKVPTVLGIGPSTDVTTTPPGPQPTTIVLEAGGDPHPFLPSFEYLLYNLPEISKVSRGRGVLTGHPDRDGIVRRIPLFVVAERKLSPQGDLLYPGNVLPTLSLEMFRVASGAGTIKILSDHNGVLGASVAGAFFPTDRNGYAYPYFTPSFDDRYISAADVLDGTYDVSAFNDGAVFLGFTRLGLAADQAETPLGLVAGVEIHTQTLESMLTGNLLRRSVFLDRIEAALVLIAGLIVIFVLPYRSPLIASAAYAGVVLMLIGCAIGSFHEHILIDAVYPVTASAAVFLAMLAANLRATESARRVLAGALQRERESEARLEGEIDAAHSIQMGLLPKPLTPAESRDVDVWALIEPARTVGGDLYDFLLIDSHRLAFAIADVSGKGVPAALFMAMTKEVLRDATLRNAEALDRAFMEANTKISETSVDVRGHGGNMMFVTVFAGVLDLVSGKLAYVNAGHDEPFLLLPGVETSQLTGQGGPPLGTVDDFPYPVEYRQLAPGEMLLLYTDGVTEAQDKSRSFYEMQRLSKLLASASPPDAKAAVDLVREDVARFVAGAEQADDITLLAVRWLGSESRAG